MSGYIGSKASVTVTSPETDSRYVNVTGDTMTGALALPAGGLNVGSGQLAIDASGRVTMPYQPAFRAQEGPLSVGGGAPAGGTAIIYYNVVFNIGGHYNNTNGRFTAPVSGLYLFASAGYWAGEGLRSLAFWKNGSRVNEHYEDQTGNCFCLIYCNANDYVISSWGYPPSSYAGNGNYWSYEGYLIG